MQESLNYNAIDQKIDEKTLKLATVPYLISLASRSPLFLKVFTVDILKIGKLFSFYNQLFSHNIFYVHNVSYKTLCEHKIIAFLSYKICDNY